VIAAAGGDSKAAVQAETQARRLASLRTAAAPIYEFVTAPDVVEIMLNPDGAIWLERAGQGMRKTPATMSPDEAMRMLKVVATDLGAELNDRNPSLGGKVAVWGARLQALIPPVVTAPVFALRMPTRIVLPLENYVERRILSELQARALADAVRDRLNVLVAGGTGSGKTTLANSLLGVVATSGDRVHLVEDTPELKCDAPNKLGVLVQPPLYTWQRAIVDAMRLRPDRIIVGEVRDGSALELLKAWNTGHPGGLSTIHANNTLATLDRLCQLIEEVIPRAPRQLVADAINVVVHIKRDPKHPAGRSITGIDRVVGLRSDGAWHLEPLVA
jgi:P-type conjugative transfer ATPase TrbB